MGIPGVSAVGAHVCEPVAGAKFQEGAPLPCGGPSRSSQVEKGSTGVGFSQNSAVGVSVDGGIGGPKAQEGAPLGSLPGRAEGAGSPGGHGVVRCPIARRRVWLVLINFETCLPHFIP